MKRYTGQKALYEAISRSCAKAKRGNVLERFLPEVSKPEEPAPPGEQSEAEPPPRRPQCRHRRERIAPAAAEKEKPRESVVVREIAKLRRLASGGEGGNAAGEAGGTGR